MCGRVGRPRVTGVGPSPKGGIEMFDTETSTRLRLHHLGTYRSKRYHLPQLHLRSPGDHSTHRRPPWTVRPLLRLLQRLLALIKQLDTRHHTWHALHALASRYRSDEEGLLFAIPIPITLQLQRPCNEPTTPCNDPATCLQHPARDDGACAPGARSNNNLCGGRLHREGAFQLGSPLALSALALALTADRRRLLRDARDAPKAATRSFGLSVSALGATILLVTLCRARLVQQRDVAAEDA